MRKPKEKIERALGERLHLKAERGQSPKSATVRKPYRPGVHGPSNKRRRASSDFSIQLNAKQKFKYTYGLKENQLREAFMKAMTDRKNTKNKITELLERRLDNTVYRLGFALSRIIARQLINHGHIQVNGRAVSFPGFEVKVGDIISFHPNSKNINLATRAAENLKQYEAPDWLLVDAGKLSGQVIALPTSLDVPFDVNLVVEYYSK